MAANFRIKVRRRRGAIDIFLNGDIDGSSAFELLDKIREMGTPGGKLTIHTGGVKRLMPFGQVVLDRRFREVRGLVSAFKQGRGGAGAPSSFTSKMENLKNREGLECW